MLQLQYGCMTWCCINCRRVADRPRDPAKWSEIADIAAALSIPVIANGDVFEYEDLQRIKDATGTKLDDLSFPYLSLSFLVHKQI